MPVDRPLPAAASGPGDEPGPEAERYLSDLARRLGVPAVRMIDSSAEPESDPLIGRRVGAYRLLRLLGRGGMGVVYLAERADGQFQKRVAVKLLPLALATESMRRRFLQERQILARLEHPGIAWLLDGGVTPEGVPYCILEYVEGAPVDLHCRQEGLGLDERLMLMAAVCDVVAYAHRRGIVHRDVKPSNVLVDRAGNVKLLDFGVAQLLDEVEHGEDTTLPRLDGRPLTPAYAAPEQLRDETPVTPATDVYALGVLLYEVVTGSRPRAVGGRTTAEILRAIEGAEPDPISRRILRSGDGAHRRIEDRWRLRALDGVVARALALDPAQRHASAEILAADLRRVTRGEPRASVGWAPLRRPGGVVRRWRRQAGSARRRVSVPLIAVASIAAAFANHTTVEPSAPPVEPSAVAVSPFIYRGGGELAHVGSGIADLIRLKLDWSSALPPTTQHAASASASSRPEGLPGAPTGARYVLSGTVADLGRTLEIRGAVYHAGDPRRIVAEHIEEASVGNFIAAVDSLADRLLGALPGLTAEELPRLEVVTSSFPEAFPEAGPCLRPFRNLTARRLHELTASSRGIAATPHPPAAFPTTP